LPFFAQQISANKFFLLVEKHLVKNNLWEDLEGEANKLGCWIEGELGFNLLKYEKILLFEEQFSFKKDSKMRKKLCFWGGKWRFNNEFR